MTPLAHNPALVPPGAVSGSTPAPPPAPATRPQGPAFGDVLAREVDKVQFSSHALQRVQRRGIDVSGPTIARLQNGVAKAAAKGSRDSVVMVDKTAFVVSVKNRTVITAVDNEHMKDHVFTNIDSAVIA